MQLTDNELCMLEQLCYLNSDVAEAAGINGFSGVNGTYSGATIGDILACFTDEKIEALKQYKSGEAEVGGSCASAEEWANIIEYLKESDLKDLVLTDTMVNSNGTTLALCFAENENSGEAVVAFKGTDGGEEWADNVEGLNTSDTECQKEALDYIESLPYDNLTVTGHSKGGNKAMYVAVTSPKVTRCVAYDGQGFSQEFIDKYWAEIETKGGIITNYSLSTDYVHALMFPVPNSNQVYCQGYGVDNIMQHHSPNSFFIMDEEGNLCLDENGLPQIVVIEEDESIEMLHDFTTFVMNNANEGDKIEIVDYVSQLLVIVFGGGELDTDKLINFVLADPDKLALIVAYLAKYMDEYDLSADDINKLLEVLGLDALNGIWGGCINIILEQLTDDDDDMFINGVLSTISIFVPFDIADFWRKANSKVKEIDTSGGCANAKGRTSQVRDFSQQVYDTLISAMSSSEGSGTNPISSWNNYAGEDWYSALPIRLMTKVMDTYFSKVDEVNQTCKQRVNTIFDNVKTIDSKYAMEIDHCCLDLKNVHSVIVNVNNSIVANTIKC